MATSISDYVILNNGVRMPRLGLGVWKSKEGGEVESAVSTALELGYRHIDTAMIYQNERGVGTAIGRSGVAREEIFLTTKLWNSDQGYPSPISALDESCARLGTDTVDLYLIHWPVKGKFIDSWKALEELYQKGKAKAIGVSNFMIKHLETLLPQVEVQPMVNQIEFHPYLMQSDLHAFCRQAKLQVEAWSPLMKGQIVDVSLIQELGYKYNKTPAQVALRWALQHGVVAIPKTVNKNRLAENADLYDFQLSDEDMARLNELDRGQRFGPDPNNFDF